MPAHGATSTAAVSPLTPARGSPTCRAGMAGRDPTSRGQRRSARAGPALLGIPPAGGIRHYSARWVPALARRVPGGDTAHWRQPERKAGPPTRGPPRERGPGVWHAGASLRAVGGSEGEVTGRPRMWLPSTTASGPRAGRPTRTPGPATAPVHHSCHRSCMAATVRRRGRHPGDGPALCRARYPLETRWPEDAKRTPGMMAPRRHARQTPPTQAARPPGRAPPAVAGEPGAGAGAGDGVRAWGTRQQRGPGAHPPAHPRPHPGRGHPRAGDTRAAGPGHANASPRARAAPGALAGRGPPPSRATGADVSPIPSARRRRSGSRGPRAGAQRGRRRRNTLRLHGRHSQTAPVDGRRASGATWTSTGTRFDSCMP